MKAIARSMKRVLVVLAVIGIYTIPLLSISGIAAIFVKIEGVKGDVTTKGYEDWIEAESLQWGVTRSITTPTGSAQEREASDPSVSEVTVTKVMDITSPLIFLEAVAGQGKEVEIHFVETGSQGDVQPYYKMKLSEALVSAMSMSSGGDRPSESVSFNFAKVEMEYTPYDDQGNAGQSIPGGYDIRTGEKL